MLTAYWENNLKQKTTKKGHFSSFQMSFKNEKFCHHRAKI